ncbi:T9SS type A sorting domain-containing protein [Aequorivita sp. H23M31]|uniref:T9SS type A sorting domain-containing protein n=2 Tax=Aequorivita ciconiae TaxID=2494375 RepID=A0A410G7K0_9FLAO|nr:T9SS type A sorting domain-containing protein [Aequorivita sp. H23M31]
MLKKLPITLICALVGLGSFAQTIVSTTPENRKVILEEYTGIYCGYCPQGHQIAQGIKDAHPDDVFLINIHQGGFAVPGANAPDFRTPWGNLLAAQTGLAGYPAATVNRQNFPGKEQGAQGTTAMNRNWWNFAATQVMAESSYVNVAVTAHIESATNVMSIHVEGYYTGNSPETTNLLNIAILQNNTLGPQSGGNMGNNYVHMHRLIDMVTGQWGEEISTTTSGTFFERDYTYQIIPHNNFVPVEIGELEVVAFLTETHQKIVSGNGTTPTITVTHANDANVRYIEPLKASCEGTQATASPKVNIQNAGSNPITSLEITSSFNGETSTFNWTGNLASLESKTITLPATSFTSMATNTIEVSVPNDDYNASNQKSVEFDAAPNGTGTVTMVLKTDAWGSECRWNLKDSAGTTLYSGGPYGNRQTITETFNLPEDCYAFTIIDTYGDGGTSVTLKDSEGTTLYHTAGDFGANETGNFSSNGVMGIESTLLKDVSIYPNPAQDILNISNAETSNIAIYDMLGRMIISKDNIEMNEQLNISNLSEGAYFVKISKEGNVTTKKFIVSK